MIDTSSRQFVPNPIVLEVFDARKQLVAVQRFTNARTQAGGVAIANAQFAGTALNFKYVALSNSSSLAVANTDTTLAGEITTLGLARVAGTVNVGTAQTALNGTVQTTVTASWTASGTTTIYGAAIFSLASGGILGYEGLAASATAVQNGYAVNLTWTLNE